MGKAQVVLPDGREIHIGGEHEDHYDPDFYIYNDVVVIDGTHIQIYGYPVSDFPPTDFHTATLAGTDVFVVGNLGYPDDRQIGTTQVLRLDVNSLEMSVQQTTGENPGWLHGHSAVLDAANASIRVTGGQRWTERVTENFHDFELCLKTFSWRMVTARNWKSWVLARADGRTNNLWQIKQEEWNRRLGLSKPGFFRRVAQKLAGYLVASPFPSVSDRQVREIESLYCSPFDRSPAVEDEEKYGSYRLSIDGVTVRFDEELFGITVTVEGELQQSKIDAILSTLEARLASIEDTAYTTQSIAEWKPQL